MRPLCSFGRKPAYSRPSWSRPTLVLVRCYSNSGQKAGAVGLSALCQKRTSHARSEMEEAASWGGLRNRSKT